MTERTRDLTLSCPTLVLFATPRDFVVVNFSMQTNVECVSEMIEASLKSKLIGREGAVGDKEQTRANSNHH